MNRDEKGRFVETGPALNGVWEENFDEYERWVSIHTDNKNTRDRRVAGARSWLKWCQKHGIHPVEDVTPDTVRKYIGDLKVNEYADTHITRSYASISKFYLSFQGDVTRPDVDVPTSEVDLLQEFEIRNRSAYMKVIHREGRTDIVAPPPEDVLKVCAHAPGQIGMTKERNECLLRLLWQTALRSDEMSRVQTKNVDLENREIKIRSSKIDPDVHEDIYIRRVWWESNLDFLMHRQMTEQEGKKHLFTGTNNNDAKLDSAYVSRIVKNAAREAGMQEPLYYDANGNVSQHLWTAHRFRHARITYLANHTNMPIHHLRMMAGHAKLETTLQYISTDWDSARDSYRTALSA